MRCRSHRFGRVAASLRRKKAAAAAAALQNETARACVLATWHPGVAARRFGVIGDIAHRSDEMDRRRHRILSFLILVAAVRAQIDYPLRTLANLISALREEDYSIRARGARRRDDAHGRGAARAEPARRARYAQRRFGEVEAAALVRSVLEHIDSAIFAFDERWRLRLVNRAGERLLGRAGGTAPRTAPPESWAWRPSSPATTPHRGNRAAPAAHGRFRHPPHHLSRERRAARAALDVRPQPGAPRGRAPGLAAAPPRARPRAQQLARADPIHRRQPGLDSRARAVPATWQEDAQQGLEVIDLLRRRPSNTN